MNLRYRVKDSLERRDESIYKTIFVQQNDTIIELSADEAKSTEEINCKSDIKIFTKPASTSYAPAKKVFTVAIFSLIYKFFVGVGTLQRYDITDPFVISAKTTVNASNADVLYIPGNVHAVLNKVSFPKLFVNDIECPIDIAVDWDAFPKYLSCAYRILVILMLLFSVFFLCGYAFSGNLIKQFPRMICLIGFFVAFFSLIMVGVKIKTKRIIRVLKNSKSMEGYTEDGSVR
ncbi:MAG: hypothetical protein E7550_00770 [Ruminococcaceae bacterium]|nr:hypothetical protein [Oscillospiraceae bacterium]